jgi:D-serine dehydratase
VPSTRDMTGHSSEPHEADLSPCEKGIPGHIASVRLADVKSNLWNVLNEDVPMPVAVLRREALESNSRRMQLFLRMTGAALAPHGKTTMSPDLFDLQLADGAWGVTVATPHQIQVARHFGYQRLFLANQLIGRSALDYVVGEMRADANFEFYCLVDSIASVGQLVAASKRGRLDRAIPVLVEMGYAGGRTGCRNLDSAMAVAREVARSAGAVTLCGIEGFEGLLRGADADSTQALVERFLDDIVALAEQCDREGLFATDPILLSAGGSAHYDLVVRRFSVVTFSRPSMILLRSGCYLTHDTGLYLRAAAIRMERSPHLENFEPEFANALEVWAYVLSIPEDGLAIVGLGKRDVSYDELPVALSWSRPGAGERGPRALAAGHKLLRLNDQHGYLEIPTGSPLAVGDMVAFGISHPCLTFDKWRVIHIVNAQYTIVKSIRTYF